MLCPEVMRALGEMGFVEPTEIQSRVIPLLLDGSDVIGQASGGQKRVERNRATAGNDAGEERRQLWRAVSQKQSHPGSDGHIEVIESLLDPPPQPRDLPP